MRLETRLRKTLTGFTVTVEDGTLVEVRRANFANRSSKTICEGCVFRDKERGARGCPYASACMAHLRPDRESVVFAKTDKL